MNPAAHHPAPVTTRQLGHRAASGAYARAALVCALLLFTLQQVIATRAPQWASAAALSPARARLRLDPNRATAAELALLPRIGPRLADNIVRHRGPCPTRPAFCDLADLDGVRGIGPATLAAISPFLEFPHPLTCASEPATP